MCVKVKSFYNSWDSRCNSPMFGTENLISTWPSREGSGGSKAIPCVIHQTAKTHTLNETCCNWWFNAVFVAGFVMFSLFFHVVALYVAYGFSQQCKKRPESKWDRGQSLTKHCRTVVHLFWRCSKKNTSQYILAMQHPRYFHWCSVHPKTVEAMIRVFSLRELFHKLLHGTLAKVAGSYSIHLWKFPWYGVWVLWTDDIIPVVGLEHLEISQGLFQVVLVLKTLDISLDWHRSNTNQLLRIVHKKLSYFQDHIPTEPQSFFPRKKKQSGRRLGKISIPSVTWCLRFSASFMEFFTSLESWCWIWCPPQTWKAVLSLVYCWI